MDTPKKKQMRSPRAPAINLENALKKAEVLYRKEPTHSAPGKVFLKHMGYSEISGPGKVSLAALRGFGLIEKRGNSLALSSKALAIIQNKRPGSGERADAIRRAAMQPKVHADVLERFGGKIPSDESLHFYLHHEKAFTDKGADQFIKQFKATMEFANLANGNILPPGESTEKEGEPAASKHGLLQSAPGALTPRPSMNQDTITLNGGQVVLQWPAKLSQGDYDDLKDWLVLMGRRAERAVVLNDDDEPESE